MSNGPHQIPDSMTIMFVPDKTSPHLRYDSPQNMKCGTSWSRVARRSTYANTNRNQSDIAFAKTTFLTVILSKQKLAYLKLRWQNYSPKLLSFLHESIKNVNMRATRGIHLVSCLARCVFLAAYVPRRKKQWLATNYTALEYLIRTQVQGRTDRQLPTPDKDAITSVKESNTTYVRTCTCYWI